MLGEKKEYLSLKIQFIYYNTHKYETGSILLEVEETYLYVCICTDKNRDVKQSV